MTDEELDRARGVEAIRVLGGTASFINLCIFAARLAREGWMPVDPDLVEARELVANKYDSPKYGPTAQDFCNDTRRGDNDSDPAVVWTLVGIKRGRELAKIEYEQIRGPAFNLTK